MDFHLKTGKKLMETYYNDVTIVRRKSDALPIAYCGDAVDAAYIAAAMTYAEGLRDPSAASEEDRRAWTAAGIVIQSAPRPGDKPMDTDRVAGILRQDLERG